MGVREDGGQRRGGPASGRVGIVARTRGAVAEQRVGGQRVERGGSVALLSERRNRNLV